MTAVVPYLAYARKDRRSKPRDPVTTRYVAQLFEAVGVDAVVTVERAEALPGVRSAGVVNHLPVSGDLRLGGRYQLQGNAGGEITRCEPPRLLGVTWEFGGERSWVEVRLTAEGAERTRLDLEHEAHVPPEFWDQYGPGAVGVGWDGALLGLGHHLLGGPAVDPAIGSSGSMSEGGPTARPSSGSGAEARASASLDHPNIVTVYAVEEAGGQPFITMALAEGRTLDRLIPDLVRAMLAGEAPVIATDRLAGRSPAGL